MSFKIDENLPAEVAAVLRDAGHDAATVRDQRLTGADDPSSYAICQRERRVLVTLDVGFGNIQSYPPAPSAGVIVLRLTDQSRPSVLSILRRVLPLLEHEPIEGKLWIVDEDRVRIRS